MDTATATDLLRQKTPLDVLARQPRIWVAGMNNFKPNMTSLPPTLKKQISDFVQKAKVGDIKTFPMKATDGTYYLTFQVTKNSPAMVPPLAQVRSQVERQARLARAPAPQSEIVRLYQAAKPTFSSDKYAAYFDTLPKSPINPGTDNKTASDR